MDWDITDIESLGIIDRKLSNNRFSPAEYEIVRQVIYRTADFDYYSLLNFSQGALERGKVALLAHTSIIVDIPAIQTAIAPLLYDTFLNPAYCCRNVSIESRTGKTKFSLGLEVLAKSHPEGIYIIGQEQTALNTLVELARRKFIQPSLIIDTVPLFTAYNSRKWLKNSSIPYIGIDGQKGGSDVAISILKSLVALTWYIESFQPNSYKF